MCARFEDAAGRRLMQRTYADFGEELMRNADGTVACPFFIDKATSHVD